MSRQVRLPMMCRLAFQTVLTVQASASSSPVSNIHLTPPSALATNPSIDTDIFRISSLIASSWFGSVWTTNQADQSRRDDALERMSSVLKVYDACNQVTAIRFVDELLRRLPFRVLVIKTDNGAEFQSRFHWHLEERDIRHVYIRPKTPHLNGKVERSHRVDEQRRHRRRYPPAQRQASPVGGLLQLPSTAWGSGWANSYQRLLAKTAMLSAAS